MALHHSQAGLHVIKSHKLYFTGDGLPCSRWVVAIWEEKLITDDALCSFVRLKIDEAPIIARGTRTNTVLMTFKTPRSKKKIKKIL